MDISSSRLAFVREKMGVQQTLLLNPDSPDDALESLKHITQGRLADVVIDASGNAASMSNSLQYATFAGKVVFVGITQSELQFHTLHSCIDAN